MARIRLATGSIAKLRGTFKTPATDNPPSVLTDPTVVTLSILRPDKTSEVRTYTVSGITRDSVGVYTSKLSLDQEGTYHWKWRGANGVDAAGISVGTLDSLREPDL